MAMFFSADAAFLSQFISLLEKMLCFALRDVCVASIRKANWLRLHNSKMLIREFALSVCQLFVLDIPTQISSSVPNIFLQACWIEAFW